MGPLGVVLSTGEFQITVADLEIPGRGFPFRLSRTYRSRRDGERSLLGHNWSLSYDEYLKPGTYEQTPGQHCDAVQWTMGNGFSEMWIKPCGQGWKAFMGFFGRIRELPLVNGVKQGYQIRYADGMVKEFARKAVDAEGDDIWLLTRIEDRNGNAITIQHEGRGISTITDTLGRTITFTYEDPPNDWRIKTVRDFKNRMVEYHYDARGDLEWVKAPEVVGTPNQNNFCDSGCAQTRKTTTYHYQGGDGCGEDIMKHNLVSITDGNGNPFLTNTYFSQSGSPCGVEGTPIDVVYTQVYGSGTLTYIYEPLGPPVYYPANTLNTKATVTDRNGNVQVHRFNTQGNPVSIEYQTNRGVRAGEIDYIETYTYVSNGYDDLPMLVSRHTQAGSSYVDSSGNVIPYADGMTGMTEETVFYDQQSTDPNADIFQKGNVLSVRRTPGSPQGAPPGQSMLETQYEYEPLFNRPVKITDPGGHVTQMTYDYWEMTYDELKTNAPVSVDETWWPINVVSPFMAAPGHSNLPDINGDGEHRAGNVIKVSEGTATDFAGQVSDEIASYYAYNSKGLLTIKRDAEYNETHFEYYPENDPDGDEAVTSPAPPDGRSLSGIGPGANGGGYLWRKTADASVTMPLPTSPPPMVGRDSGQNPTEQNVLARFKYDKVGNITEAINGQGVLTQYAVNQLNQIVQITHAAQRTDCGVLPICTGNPLGYLEEFKYDANNNVVEHRTEQRDDPEQAPPGPGAYRWVTQALTYDMLDQKKTETVSTSDTTLINGHDSISLTTSYDYDNNGNLQKTTFPVGNVVLRFYDERNLLYREVAPKTDQVGMTYNPAEDSITEYDYDGSGNVIRVTDPEGHKSLIGYDGYNRKVVSFDSAFQKTEWIYDSRGKVVDQIFRGTLGGATPIPTSPPTSDYLELSRRKLFYDELGRLRRSDAHFFKFEGLSPAGPTDLHTDGNAGLTTHASSDPATAVADGWVTSLIGYDRLGRVVKSVDDNGHASEIRYDGLGRKLKVFENAAAPFAYVPGGIDERNAVELVYQAGGNIKCKLETMYGADHERTGGIENQKLHKQMFRTDFKFDSMNRLTDSRVVGKVDDPDNPGCSDNFTSPAGANLITSFKYDSRGNRIRVKDPKNGLVRTLYDGLNRTTQTQTGLVSSGPTDWEGSAPSNMSNTTNPDGVIKTTFSYDMDSRLTSVKDDNNRITSFIYDKLNRQTRITYPDATYQQVTYNRDSLATSWTHSSNTVFTLTATTSFDWLHRPTQIIVNSYGAPNVLGTHQQIFEYDGLGRLTLAQDDTDLADGGVDSKVVLTYNSMGKVLSEAQIWRDTSSGQEMSGTKTVNSVYNGVGFRKEITYPGGRVLTITPDELNRPKRIQDSYMTPDLYPVSDSFYYDYLGTSRVLKRTAPNRTKLTMVSGAGDFDAAGYDNVGRIRDYANKVDAVGGEDDVARFVYGYDSVNNRTYERRVHEFSSPYWKGETFEYDAVYRLINRQEGNLDDGGVLHNTPITTQNFTLDGLGNWKTHMKNSSTYNQTINSLNQYTVFNGPSGQKSLMYDFLGNLTYENGSVGEQTYHYDFLNRLVAHLSISADYTTYRYDALGRRISKNLNGFTHTRYFYDGDRLIEESDGTGGSPVMSYVYGLGSDEVLSRRKVSGGVTSDLFYHTNALGSVVAVTRTDGGVEERYKYDAYGQVTFMNSLGTPQGCNCSPAQNNILYTGRYFDIESRLYYYRARTYNPYLGRFLQRDPLGERASLNLYNYVFNNPIRLTDPSGMLSSEQRQNLVYPQTGGSRNALCLAGTCGGGGSWSLGTSKFAEGSMNIMVSQVDGVSFYTVYGEGGSSQMYRGADSLPSSSPNGQPAPYYEPVDAVVKARYYPELDFQSFLANMQTNESRPQPPAKGTDVTLGLTSHQNAARYGETGFFESYADVFKDNATHSIEQYEVHVGTTLVGGAFIVAGALVAIPTAMAIPEAVAACPWMAPITVPTMGGVVAFGVGGVAIGLDTWLDQLRYYMGGNGIDLLPSVNVVGPALYGVDKGFWQDSQHHE